MPLGFSVIINPLLLPGLSLDLLSLLFSYHWTAMSLKAAPLHLHFLGTVLLLLLTESRRAPPAGLVLMLRMLSLSNRTLLTVQIFFSRAWAAPLPPGPADWLLDSGVWCFLYSLGSCLSSVSTSHHCLSWYILLRVLNCLGLASRLDHILHLWEMWIF